MEASVTAESVVGFLNRFEEVAMKEDFSLLEDMIDERGDATVKKARFYLCDIVVLTTDSASATATYTYNWEGAQGCHRGSDRRRAPRTRHRAAG